MSLDWRTELERFLIHQMHHWMLGTVYSNDTGWSVFIPWSWKFDSFDPSVLIDRFRVTRIDEVHILHGREFMQTWLKVDRSTDPSYADEWYHPDENDIYIQMLAYDYEVQLRQAAEQDSEEDEANNRAA